MKKQVMSSTKIILNVAVSLILLLSFSCEQVDNNKPPEIEVTNEPPENTILYSPANQSIDIPLDVQLQWNAAIDPNGDVVLFDVYLGTQSNYLESIAVNISDTVYNTILKANTTYYWRIVAKDNNEGESESAVWRFKTEMINWSDSIQGVFTDPQNNYNYPVVKIGNQVWFAEDLRNQSYANRDQIYNGNGSGDLTGDTTLHEFWLGYDGQFDFYGETYGLLYTWLVAEEDRNVCPDGWHVPTYSEWSDLIGYLGGENVAGGKLKEKGFLHWDEPNTGATNESRFSALPGGIGLLDGKFQSKGKLGIWWTSTSYTDQDAWAISVADTSAMSYSSTIHKNSGLSIRCIKD